MVWTISDEAKITTTVVTYTFHCLIKIIARDSLVVAGKGHDPSVPCVKVIFNTNVDHFSVYSEFFFLIFLENQSR